MTWGLLGLLYKQRLISSRSGQRGLAGRSRGDAPTPRPPRLRPGSLAGHRKSPLVPGSLQSIFLLPLIFIGLCLKRFVYNYTVCCTSCLGMTNAECMSQQRAHRPASTGQLVCSETMASVNHLVKQDHFALISKQSDTCWSNIASGRAGGGGVTPRLGQGQGQGQGQEGPVGCGAEAEG